MNIFTVLKLLSNLRSLRSHECWTRTQLESYQTQQIAQLRAFAYQHSSFYRQFHQGMFDKPLSELPILTKQVLMAHFDELVTDPKIHLADIRTQRDEAPDARYLGKYWVNATSGSTGSPGIFLFNDQEWATVLASFTRGYEWAGVRIKLTRRNKIAIVSSVTPWHMSYLVGQTLRSPWSTTLRLSATEPIEQIVHQLNEWQSEVLIAYASMMRILAVEQLENRLQIAPQVVFTSSEVLTDETRRLVETAWGKRLFNQYAATETAGIAAECEHHMGLHLYEDLVIVENVDEHNRPVPAGVYGDKVLVTVLFNRTQPLIRYEIGDSIRLSDRSDACGRPFRVVDGIQGRQEDILHFPSADGKQVAIHPNLFHQVMDTVSVSGWQILHRNDGLHVLLSGSNSTNDQAKLIEDMSRALAKQGAVVPYIYVEHVDTIPRTSNGKAPLIRAIF
ncbi:MAG: phenylacetate--CoA ligase family protein [Chloroflexota bacterium]|nr:phenylacetate--CoA ligase family protein [Chloroflexota bacterium]